MAMNTIATARLRRENSLLLALAATAVLALVYAVAVRTTLGQALDTRTMLDISAALADKSWPTRVLSLVTPLSVVAATAALTGLVALARGRRAAVDVVMIAGGTVVGAAILKAVLTRPQLLDDSTNSLPSGHVAAIAGLAAASVVALPARYRPPAALIGSLSIAITSIATLALRWHRPSDAVAATLVAVIAAALATAGQHHLASRTPRPDGSVRHLKQALPRGRS